MIKLDLNPPAKQLRQFGWIALFGFPLLGWMLTRFGVPMVALYIGIGIGVLMALFALLKADAAIKPVYVGLMVITFPLALIISTVLLGLIFFGMFAPVGIVLRLIRRDPLHRRRDPAAPSYWHVRTAPRTPASYLRLY